MLYDGGKRPTKSGFLDFLQTKDPTESFNWWDYDACPATQYLESLGMKKTYKNVEEWHEATMLFSLASCDTETFGECFVKVRERFDNPQWIEWAENI